MAIDLLAELKKNPFVLAPMAGITDCAFRNFMKKRGASVVVTELVSSHGIEYKSQRTLDLMRYDESQRPVGIQLFGETPEIIASAAKVAEEAGADFIDLNFGCPVPKVVKKGAGSAVLKDLDQLKRILSATKNAVNIPVTIKIRTGWDANSRNAEEVCQIAFDEGMTWVAIHGRTRAQGYSGDADWEYIKQVKSTAKIPILGNGDLNSAQTAVKRLTETGCDGVLIGRGCLKNPYIFLESLSLLQNGEIKPGLRQDYVKTWIDLRDTLNLYCDESLMTLQLRKFASWFSTGYPGAAQFRKSIFQSQGLDQVWASSLDFFESLSLSQQADTSHEPFLMGGHG